MIVILQQGGSFTEQIITDLQKVADAILLKTTSGGGEVTEHLAKQIQR